MYVCLMSGTKSNDYLYKNIKNYIKLHPTYKQAVLRAQDKKLRKKVAKVVVLTTHWQDGHSIGQSRWQTITKSCETNGETLRRDNKKPKAIKHQQNGISAKTMSNREKNE